MNSYTNTITTTASLVVPADESPRNIHFQVIGNGTVYIGGSNVTAANGLPLIKHTAPIAIFLRSKESLYAITATATEDLRTLR